jgi:hypothetical protein
MSDWYEYGWLRIRSGDIYLKVPTNVPHIAIEFCNSADTPKSVTCRTVGQGKANENRENTHLHLAFRIDQQIGRLDVSVHPLLMVEVSQTPQDLQHRVPNQNEPADDKQE